MKSIIQKDKEICYLCQKLHPEIWPGYATEEHHIIFGTANRKQSEKYGLKVYLCKAHHTESKESPHKNHEIARLLQRDAQKAFEATFPDKDFMEIFGRNYKEDT